MVIFAMGVLMVIQLNTALGEQMKYSAKASAVVVMAHERLDSLESLPFDSLVVGTAGDTITIEGRSYERLSTIALVTALLYSIDVTVSPLASGDGPSYTAGSYAAQAW